jgi:hypothetical protein
VSIVSLLYRIARAAAWARAGALAAQGRPLPLMRRIRNRPIMRVVGRALRW